MATEHNNWVKNIKPINILLLIATTSIVITSFLVFQYGTKLEKDNNQLTTSLSKIDSTITSLYINPENYNSTTLLYSVEAQINSLKSRRIELEKENKIVEVESILPYVLVIISIVVSISFAYMLRLNNFKNAKRKSTTIENYQDEHVSKDNARDNKNYLDQILASMNKDISKNELINLKNLLALKDYADKINGNKEDYLETLNRFIISSKNITPPTEYINDDVDIIFEDIQKRLSTECIRLNKHALQSLFLAFITVLLLFVIIFYFNINVTNNTNEWNSFIMTYIPRLVSVISTLTIFLYFIRIYKTNIADVKYYQNEMTNIEQKYLALNASLAYNATDSKNTIITEMAQVERNIIITHEQKSLEIERVRMENEINKSYLDKVFELFTLFKNEKKDV